VIGDGSYVSPKVDTQSVDVILRELASHDGDGYKPHR